jgi:mannose-6-phosphate isomerase class I
MKVLAANEPLSLQAHPSAAQGGRIRPRRAQRHPGNGSGAQLAIQYVRSGSKTVAAEARTVLELGERYPGDASVLAALLLNRLSLQPGEAIYLPAGNLHTYLQGVAVEVMANSDNVLRRASPRNTWTRPSCCGCWTSRRRPRLRCTPK